MYGYASRDQLQLSASDFLADFEDRAALARFMKQGKQTPKYINEWLRVQASLKMKAMDASDEPGGEGETAEPDGTALLEAGCDKAIPGAVTELLWSLATGERKWTCSNSLIRSR